MILCKDIGNYKGHWEKTQLNFKCNQVCSHVLQPSASSHSYNVYTSASYVKLKTLHYRLPNCKITIHSQQKLVS